MATTKPSRLGKGLDALMTKTDDDNRVAFKEIPLDKIQPNPKQPRRDFDEDELDELAESIKAFGVLQPVVVRPLKAGAYELIMGERRLP